MIRNFITDTDLQKYYPKLSNYLWSGSSDYSTQIAEAFNIVLDDVRAKGIEPRLLMTPLDLLRAATTTSDQDTLTSDTHTASTNETHIDGKTGFTRFVINTTAMTGSSGYVFTLQGSNDIDVDDSTEPDNWTTITTITPDGTGEDSVLFYREFKYYRVISTITAAVPSITFTASLVEIVFDRWIIHKAFEMIFRDFSKQENDTWDNRSRIHAQMYSSAVQNYRYTVDDNDDNLIDDADIFNQTNQASFTR